MLIYISIFCENYVCNQHLVKERKDPLEKEKMHKICNCCEDEILEKMITEKVSKYIHLKAIKKIRYT